MLHHDVSAPRYSDTPFSIRELLQFLTSTELQRFERIRHRRHYGTDQSVFTAGEHPHFLYLLQSGHASVIHLDSVYERRVDPADPDQIFGMIETLSEQHFSSTLTTATPCDFDVVDSKDFLELLIEMPEFCLKLVRLLSSHYQEEIRKVRSG